MKEEKITAKKIEEKEVYHGKRIQVKELRYDTGKQIIYREHVIAGTAVVILCIKEDNMVVMVQEERTAVRKKILSLPAGMIEEGETPEEAAIRELEEETGYLAKKATKLIGYHPTCGYSDEYVIICIAEELTKTQQHLDVGEELIKIEIPYEELIKKIKNNEIMDSSTNMAVMYYELFYRNIK